MFHIMYDEHLWKPSQASLSSEMHMLSKHWFHFLKVIIIEACWKRILQLLPFMKNA